MLSLLKLRKEKTIDARLPPRGRSGALIDVFDISGPLPDECGLEPLPVIEEPAVEEPVRRVMRHEGGELRRLPREMDPFECDFPWNGWVEPHHRAVIRSPYRSATFEQDLQRVLAIFAA